MGKFKGLGRLWKSGSKPTNRPFTIPLTIEEQVSQRRRHLRAGCFIILVFGLIGIGFWVLMFYSLFA